MEKAIRETITAALVADDQRLAFLPRHFGRLLLSADGFENYMDKRFSKLCPEYNGGYWDFYDLSNGGCYLAPRGEQYRIRKLNNAFDERVSAHAAGIIITLNALSELSYFFENVEGMSKRFCQLLKFAAHHAEALLIFRSID
jgi:hypothetical protein